MLAVSPPQALVKKSIMQAPMLYRIWKILVLHRIDFIVTTLLEIIRNLVERFLITKALVGCSENLRKWLFTEYYGSISHFNEN